MPSGGDENGHGAEPNVIPAFSKPGGRRDLPAPGGFLAPRAARSIGAILVDTGRLSLEDAERIIQLQREKGLRFGDAALELGVVSAADIDYAVSRQFDHAYLTPGESAVSPEVVAAYQPLRPEVEVLRALRNQLMLRWFSNEPVRKALTIISASRQEGRSFIAANLAVVFSQLGERTLLIDADLRQPRQHALFGIDNRLGLSAVLSGRAGPDAVQRIAGLDNLAVLASGALPPNPQELLARPVFGQLLDLLIEQFDVILIDSPAAGETADAQTLVVHSGAALVVTRKNSTRTWHVQGISDSVAQAKAALVGTVLNDW